MENSKKLKSKLKFKQLPKPMIIEREDGRREQVVMKAWVEGAEEVKGYGPDKQCAAADLLFERGGSRDAIVNYLQKNNLDTKNIDKFLENKQAEKNFVNSHVLEKAKAKAAIAEEKAKAAEIKAAIVKTETIIEEAKEARKLAIKLAKIAASKEAMAKI